MKIVLRVRYKNHKFLIKNIKLNQDFYHRQYQKLIFTPHIHIMIILIRNKEKNMKK